MNYDYKNVNALASNDDNIDGEGNNFQRDIKAQ